MTALQKTTAKKPDKPGLVGRRLTIVPGVGLLDLDATGKGELVERLAGKVGDQWSCSRRGCGRGCSPPRSRSAWT